MRPRDELAVEPCASTRRFLDAQRGFYRDDPYYVPPMTLLDRRKVDLRKNPFFEHAEGALWVARRGGAVVGRISASRDRLHDKFHGDRIGFFGHFEAADESAAHALLETAERWVVERGATALRGPIDFSTNYRCGLLIEGAGDTPFVTMPHNPVSYAEWIESFGLRKAKDLLALRVLAENLDLSRMDRMVGRIRERTPVETRMLDVRRFDREVQVLWDLYNRIWERNWGFVPMTHAEFLSEARELRAVVRKELTVIVERDGEPVAFALGVPDVNLGIRACDGRLLPFGWWRFLRTMRSVRRFRVITLGVLPELRGTGVDAVLLRQVIAQGLAIEFRDCEASWILEDNVGMLRPLLTAGGEVYRRYRIYERAVRAG